MKITINRLTINLNHSGATATPRTQDEPSSIKESASSRRSAFLAHILTQIMRDQSDEAAQEELNSPEEETNQAVPPVAASGQNTSDGDTLATQHVMIGFPTPGGCAKYRAPTSSTAQAILDAPPVDDCVVVVPTKSKLGPYLTQSATTQYGFVNLYSGSDRYGQGIYESEELANRYTNGDYEDSTVVRVAYLPYTDFRAIVS